LAAVRLELRATKSLARPWQRQRRHGDGQAAVTAIYNTFSEGLTTPDLVDAAAQLIGLE
jgi:hypothetical protein